MCKFLDWRYQEWEISFLMAKLQDWMAQWNLLAWIYYSFHLDIYLVNHLTEFWYKLGYFIRCMKHRVDFGLHSNFSRHTQYLGISESELSKSLNYYLANCQVNLEQSCKYYWISWRFVCTQRGMCLSLIPSLDLNLLQELQLRTELASQN